MPPKQFKDRCLVLSTGTHPRYCRNLHPMATTAVVWHRACMVYSPHHPSQAEHCSSRANHQHYKATSGLRTSLINKKNIVCSHTQFSEYTGPFLNSNNRWQMLSQLPQNLRKYFETASPLSWNRKNTKTWTKTSQLTYLCSRLPKNLNFYNMTWPIKVTMVQIRCG